jgi:predicted transposase YdaD
LTNKIVNDGMKKIRKHQIEKEEKYKKELRRFDPILKEIFSKAAGKLISIATGEKINKELEDITTEIEFVKSLRPDMVFRTGDKIFHIEIQAQQDKDLPERMLIYSLAIKEKFGQKPVQIILFVGKGNPPPPFFKDEFTIHKFIVLDMKKINPDEFIKSDKPEEVIVGILAGKFKDKPEIIEKVKKRIVEIVKSEKEIAKYIDSISFLAGLFDVKIEVKPMPIEVDIRKTFLYKWGKEEGLKEGLKKAILLDIKSKFGFSKAKRIKNILDKINDTTRLEKIKREIIKAKTWDDFVRSIKNSNLKNKI